VRTGFLRQALAPRIEFRVLLFALFLFTFFCLSPAPARARPQTQVLVVLADHLTLDDVTRPDLPGLARMRREGELALMSPGLAHRPDPVANVYATLGAGDSVSVGDVSQGRMGAALRRRGLKTALIGDADGDDTGIYRPALLFLPNPDSLSEAGTVPDPTAPGGKREDPARLWAATQAALTTCDLVVVHFGDFARAERENGRGFLLPTAYQKHRQRALLALDDYLGRVLAGLHPSPSAVVSVQLVVPTPPLAADGSWDQLTPYVDWLRAGSGFSTSKDYPETSLISHTTQTPGLVAARDIAPTVLLPLLVPQPVQMTGAAALPEPLSWANLMCLDRMTRVNQEAQNPLFWTVGLGAAAIVFSGLGLFLMGRMTPRAANLCRYGLRVVSAWPLVLLLAPLTDPHAAPGYLAIIAGLVALLALLPSPSVIFALTALVLVGDGLTGTRLISQSALSEYALSGIRFYGIGNEYMGVLIGGALLVCAASGWKEGRGQRWGTLGWFALVTFVLSFPAFGAKAGGAVTALATFAVAWRLLAGKPVSWKHCAGGVVAGFALVLLWGVLGHWLHLRRTHLETATEALGRGRLGYIVGVSLRKVGLAARVLVHPGTLLGLTAFAAMGWIARQLLLGQIRDYLGPRPREAAVLRAGLWGCLVALLFNDSGVVAAIQILQCLVPALLHGLYGEVLCASSDSTSATSASASPSVTRLKSSPPRSGSSGGSAA